MRTTSEALTVRPAVDGDQEAVAVLLAEAFSTTVVDPAVIAPEGFLVAEDERGVVAAMRVIDAGQWHGGRSLSCAAVASVAVAAHARGRGFGRALMASFLTAAQGRGTALSLLYPSVPQPYRRVGYETAGDRFVMSVPLYALPKHPVPRVERCSDLAELRACYDRWATGSSGAVDRSARWWDEVVLRGAGDAVQLAHVVREEGRIVGYVVCRKVPVPGVLPYDFDLEVRDAAWTSPTAGVELLAVLGSYAGLGRSLRWPGRPGDAWSRLVGACSPEVHHSFPWMLRLVDVPAALTGRGYRPDGDCTLRMRVHDAVLPANDGCFELALRAGTLELRRADSAEADLDVGALAALYTGYVSAAELALAGRLTGDECVVDRLDRVFPASRPCLTELF